MQPYDMPLEKLEQYKPTLNAQPDLRAFWDATLSEMRDEPWDEQLEAIEYPVRGVAVHRLQFRGFRGAMIQAWYARPLMDPEPLPGLVLYHGYNWNYEGNLQEVVNWALRGYAVVGMSARGQQASGQSMPSPHGHVAGWMTQGILDPDVYYYRGVYSDAVRTLEWLSRRPQVDPNRIGVTGGSQGGGLALAAAALSDIPRVAAVDYPYLCHFRRAVDVAPAGPYGEITEFLRQNGDPAAEAQAFRTLSYFDVMNLAPWIQAPALISAGLVDQLTPPSTIFAAYNHIGSEEKAIRVFRYFGHEFIPRFQYEKLGWLKRVLQDGRDIE